MDTSTTGLYHYLALHTSFDPKNYTKLSVFHKRLNNYENNIIVSSVFVEIKYHILWQSVKSICYFR